MSLNFKIIESTDISEFQNEFTEIEKNITYPLNNGKDSFIISHGNHYEQFFNDMGKTRFMIVHDSKKLCGAIAGVWKNIKVKNKEVCALYIADLKIIPEYRGGKVALKMLFSALFKYIFYVKYKGWDFLYYVGMNGENGNVTKTFKGFHLGKLSKPTCTQNIYIIDSDSLNDLSSYNHKESEDSTIELSPDNLNKIITNKGKKDIILSSSNERMKLAHIHFQIDSNINNTLNEISRRITNEYSDYSLCFAVDQRNKKFINFLDQNNISRNTTCTIYTFNWPIIGHNLKRHEFVSLSTAEI